jgi:hypothetical protein
LLCVVSWATEVFLVILVILVNSFVRKIRLKMRLLMGTAFTLLKITLNNYQKLNYSTDLLQILRSKNDLR